MLLTKALAEIKLTASKLTKAQQEVAQYSWRKGDQVDPLQKDGGSNAFVTARLQSIRDMYENIIVLRNRIRAANEKTKVTVEGMERSIADWLVWKREVAEPLIASLSTALLNVQNARRNAGTRAVGSTDEPIISHLNEKAIMEEVTRYKTILGSLDGELSVVNATIEV